MLCLSNVLQLLPVSGGYEYHLLQGDQAVKFVYTSLTPTNAFDYLTNLDSTGYGVNFNEAVVNADTIQMQTTPGTVLNTSWLTQVQANGGMGVILVEGSATSTRPLMLEIWRNGKLLAGAPLYLSISSVEQMFRCLNLCNFGNGTVDPTATSRNIIERAANQRQEFGFCSRLQCEPAGSARRGKRNVQTFLLVRFQGEVLWRDMEWSGVEGRLRSGSPFNDHIYPNYHTNVVNTLDTALSSRNFSWQLQGDTVVVAHSLGNMVALSAISDYSATPKPLLYD